MFDIGEHVLLLDDVIGVFQFPSGGGASHIIHRGDVLKFRSRFDDFFEFENITSKGIYRIRWVWFCENTSRWKLLDQQRGSSSVNGIPKNNDGREYCFDPSCGGKTRKARGFHLDEYDVCNRCGK